MRGHCFLVLSGCGVKTVAKGIIFEVDIVDLEPVARGRIAVFLPGSGEPNSLFAGWAGFQRNEAYFQASEASREVPKIQFPAAKP